MIFLVSFDHDAKYRLGELCSNLHRRTWDTVFGPVCPTFSRCSSNADSSRTSCVSRRVRVLNLDSDGEGFMRENLRAGEKRREREREREKYVCVCVCVCVQKRTQGYMDIR